MWSDFATKDLAKVDACMKIHMYTYICIYRFEMVRVCVYMNTFGWVESEGFGSFYCLCDLPKPSICIYLQDRARPLKLTNQELRRDTDLAYWFRGCDSTLFLLLDDQRPQLP